MPVHIPKAVTAEDVVKIVEDPEGRVKQQTAEGVVQGDEKKIAEGDEAAVKAFEEIKKQALANEAPNVITQSRTSTLKERRSAAEKELETLADQRNSNALQRRAMLKAQISELRELENRQVHGAPSRLPRGLVLDLGDLPAKYPDRHFRWVNIDAPGKAAAAQAMGYTRTPNSEGGKQIGDLAVFHTSQEHYAQRIADRAVSNQQSVEAYKNEITNMAEKVVREIYDKTGKDISKGRGTLLVEDK